jgi:hypothetical protein
MQKHRDRSSRGRNEVSELATGESLVPDAADPPRLAPDEAGSGPSLAWTRPKRTGGSIVVNRGIATVLRGGSSDSSSQASRAQECARAHGIRAAVRKRHWDPPGVNPTVRAGRPALSAEARSFACARKIVYLVVYPSPENAPQDHVITILSF